MELGTNDYYAVINEMALCVCVWMYLLCKGTKNIYIYIYMCIIQYICGHIVIVICTALARVRPLEIDTSIFICACVSQKLYPRDPQGSTNGSLHLQPLS